MTTLSIINAAMDYAKTEVEKIKFDIVSNGSEAWQTAQITTKNLLKLQNDLKSIGYEKDSYWGYTINAPYNDYFKEEVWLNAFSKSMTEQGIATKRVERLL